MPYQLPGGEPGGEGGEADDAAKTGVTLRSPNRGPEACRPSGKADVKNASVTSHKWRAKYPGIIRLWENAWTEYSRSSTTRPKSAESSTRRTPSSRSMPEYGERPGPGAFPHRPSSFEEPLPRGA